MRQNFELSKKAGGGVEANFEQQQQQPLKLQPVPHPHNPHNNNNNNKMELLLKEDLSKKR